MGSCRLPSPPLALSLQKEIIACKGSEGKMHSNLNTDVQASVTNQSAIHVGRNPEHHSCMQHLLPKYHWLWEQVEDKVFSLDNFYED
jgi:hypothetical protein